MPQDCPSATDLLDVAAVFIEREVVPSTEGGLRFRARVAANVLRIVAREIQLGESHLRQEVKILAGTLGCAEPAATTVPELHSGAVLLNRELCERIRAGTFDAAPGRAQMLGALRKIVEGKLEIANPLYLEADRKLRTNHL